MKEFEVALQIVKDRYRPIIDNQKEMFCVFDKNFIIQHVNEAYCKYFKKEYTELIGKSFFSLIPENEHCALIEKFSKISPENRIIITTHEVITNNENPSWHEWKDIAVFDENNEIIEFQSIGRDVTDIVRLEAEIEKLKQKLFQEDSKKERSFIGKFGGKKIIVNADEICYIKANLISVEMVAKNKKARVSMQIKEIQKALEGLNFFRIHRSYMVNLDKIKLMESVGESKYKIHFTDIDEHIVSSKRGAKELRNHIKSKN